MNFVTLKNPYNKICGDFFYKFKNLESFVFCYSFLHWCLFFDRQYNNKNKIIIDLLYVGFLYIISVLR